MHVISSHRPATLSLSLQDSYLKCAASLDDVNLQFLLIHSQSCKISVKKTTQGGEAFQRSLITYLAYTQWYHPAQGSEEGQILSRHHLLLKTTQKTIIRTKTRYTATQDFMKGTFSSPALFLPSDKTNK